MLRVFLARIADLVLRRQREDRLRAEVETHLAFLTDEYVSRGMSQADARLAARRRFGGVEQMKERYRDQRGLPFVEVLLQDVRFACRLMRKSPAFSLTAAGSLALSIGALTLTFSTVNTLVFRPLPIADPISPAEPVLVLAIVGLLAVIALLSCAGPVRRSLSVDPLAALREE
jgi:hypothetical protein